MNYEYEFNQQPLIKLAYLKDHSNYNQICFKAKEDCYCFSRTSTTLIGRREELNRLDEGDLFMELIRDVANELDINILCHKILVNVGLLTHADRGSLFLAKGPLEDRYLVAKLFDVTQDTELDEAVQRAKNEEIKIPFGVGIAGYVAQSKQIINIKDAYKVNTTNFVLYEIDKMIEVGQMETRL